jgi:hypothetical protein
MVKRDGVRIGVPLGYKEVVDSEYNTRTEDPFSNRERNQW